MSSEPPVSPNLKTASVLHLQNVSVYYEQFLAVDRVSLVIPKNNIIAFIGPSGCGKSTLLRCLNRMNDLVQGAKVNGSIEFLGTNIYDHKIDPVELRRQVGMVFQQPNPFPKSIYENIAFGARINGYQGDIEELVETALKQAFLWEEVKDKLHQTAHCLSGGQQQRLCIARAIALQPDVLLMDEPCSALDPISTQKIEELLYELKHLFTIVIVTHNMQQASRVSDWTAFFNVDVSKTGNKTGHLVEYSPTEILFNEAEKEVTRDYITGKFG